jgi:hypothetical protein
MENNQKRFTVTVDLYIYADDDLTAKVKANRFVKDAEFMVDNTENKISIVSILEAPFGKIGNLREVK